MSQLLERDRELDALNAAVTRAAHGAGSTTVVTGEAGIGKTSLLRTFVAGLTDGARVLVGACEDLVTPRALGPLRDAAARAGGPLSEALEAGIDSDRIYFAVTAVLAAVPHPAVLIVEDAHWADSATLDLLRYLSRRILDLPAVLVVSYREDNLGRDHPLRHVLAGLTAPGTNRLRLAPLSPAAVATLAGSTAANPAELFELTAGNPFFVTEVLATPDQRVPETILDAVLARVRTLSPDAQDVLSRLAVVPAGVDVALLRALVPDLRPVSEAEQAGVLELRRDRMGFRHELARRAVVGAIAAADRIDLNAAVLAALLASPRPDPFRVLHHALEAGNDIAVVHYGPAAAAEASRVGAHRQAASCYADILDRARLLTPAEVAQYTESYAWALSNSNQLHAAADSAANAVRLWQQVGNTPRLIRALVTASRQQWLTEQSRAASRSAEEALRLAAPTGDTAEHALALLNRGGLLVLLDEEQAGTPLLEQARVLADSIGEADIVALCDNYLGSARLQLGDRGGLDNLLASVDLAADIGNHEYVLRGYYNLAEGLWRLGDSDAAMGYIAEAERYSRNREFPVHSYMFDARRYRLMAMRGQWAAAEAGLRGLLAGHGDPGMIGRETIPILGRVLLRQGKPEALDWLTLAKQHAERCDLLEWIVPTGLAMIEYAWLSDRPAAAGRYPALLRERTDRPGMAVPRAELLRYLQRLGEPASLFAGCPEPWAAGISGDWRAAADEWLHLGDRYEAALELADSGEVDATVQAVELLDDLGAVPALLWARERLRALGVTRKPRRAAATTRANPAGLTERQLQILQLVRQGHSTAEIAESLVVSARTVDHHIAAACLKLGVHSRREAVVKLASFETS